MSRLRYFLLVGFMVVSCLKASEEVIETDTSKVTEAIKEADKVKEADTPKETVMPKEKDKIKEVDRFKETDAKVVQKIYQTLLDMHDFFTFFDIKYLIEQETLIGAVRHKGLVPWEDGLSVCMFKSDEEKFLKALPVLLTMGYEVIGMYYGYKVYPKNGMAIEEYPWKFPACDIFIINTDGQKVFFEWRIRKEKERNFEIDLSDVLPLRKYTFGSLIVFGPRNPAPTLKFTYGENYLTVASKWYDHANEEGFKKIFKTLEDKDDFKHLSPQEPLVHNLLTTGLVMYWPLDFAGKYPDASW